MRKYPLAQVQSFLCFLDIFSKDKGLILPSLVHFIVIYACEMLLFFLGNIYQNANYSTRRASTKPKDPEDKRKWASYQEQAGEST